MKTYQIIEDYENLNHAGSKATNDAVQIFREIGAIDIPILVSTRKKSIIHLLRRQLNFYINWRKIYRQVENNSIVILQNPFRFRQFGRTKLLLKLKKKKDVKIISLIHDVELLRYDNPKNQKEFQETLKIADRLIVHNQQMKSWFIKRGVESDKLIVLEIFDYLSEKSSEEKTTYSKNVYIAGNLAKDKSPYVYNLEQVPKVQFNLMGVNYNSDNEIHNVSYLGSFLPEEVPSKLNNGFGLVWDGPSVETCSGVTGDYLRYNNPHKLSLYLSSALPVIIWSEAAESEFVTKYGVGITVSSLKELADEINSITEEKYENMVRNTIQIKEKLQSGHYLKKAITQSIDSIKEK